MATGLAEVYAARRKDLQERQQGRRLEKAKEVIGTYRALIKKVGSACRLILAQLEMTGEDLELGNLLRDGVQPACPVLDSLDTASDCYTDKELDRLKAETSDLNRALQLICKAALANCQLDMEFIDVDVDERVAEDIRPLLVALKLLESLGIVDFGLDSDADAAGIEESAVEHDLIEQFDAKATTSREDQFLARVLDWGYITENDDYRIPVAYSSGGIALTDEAALRKLRNVGKEIIKRLGKKILRGDLNLTTMSFPIACMLPNSALHNCLRSCMMLPMYLGRAAQISDPIERLKLTVVGTISSFVHTSTFLKPLNPVLGETLSASYEDGTELFSEQSFHHPPISHIYLVGPRNLYKGYGYYQFASHAHLNSFSVPLHVDRQLRT